MLAGYLLPQRARCCCLGGPNDFGNQDENSYFRGGGQALTGCSRLQQIDWGMLVDCQGASLGEKRAVSSEGTSAVADSSKKIGLRANAGVYVGCGSDERL